MGDCLAKKLTIIVREQQKESLFCIRRILMKQPRRLPSLRERERPSLGVAVPEVTQSGHADHELFTWSTRRTLLQNSSLYRSVSVSHLHLTTVTEILSSSVFYSQLIFKRYKKNLSHRLQGFTIFSTNFHGFLVSPRGSQQPSFIKIPETTHIGRRGRSLSYIQRRQNRKLQCRQEP